VVLSNEKSTRPPSRQRRLRAQDDTGTGSAGDCKAGLFDAATRSILKDDVADLRNSVAHRHEAQSDLQTAGCPYSVFLASAPFRRHSSPPAAL
jgi:hypothetical protein